MSTNDTRAVFDATASTYDRDRMKLIPGHDRVYAAALDLIPPTAITIVELGAGSGLFSQMLRNAFPTAALHLYDFSAPMLEQARTRLGHDPHIQFTLADYTTAELPHADAIVSALSIHHLEDDRKRALFAHIHSRLQPGGVFINADQILAPTTEAETEARRQWLHDVREAGASDTQIQASLLRQQEDRCATSRDQLGWLAAANFREARCAFHAGRFAVFCAIR